MGPGITLGQISEGHGDHWGWEVVQSLETGNQLPLVTKLEESLQLQQQSQETDPHPDDSILHKLLLISPKEL